jgi:hypothetical protein
MLWRSDQVETPISSLVGGHDLWLSGMAVALLPEDVSPTAPPPPPPPLRTTPEDERSTRLKAAVRADLVSSHAGLSQSSPPIVFSNDASGSSLLLLLALPPLTSLPLELEDVMMS